MKFLENELLGLNEVFRDVAALVHEQQQVILGDIAEITVLAIGPN